MLFIYPKTALAQNWLNPSIIYILESGMTSIINNKEPTKWPTIIPESVRNILKSRSGIKSRLQSVWESFKNLDRDEQIKLINALNQQISLPNNFSDDSICTQITLFSDEIRDSIKELFKFLFEEQLLSIKIDGECLRDIHYKEIYSNAPERLCPFCGLSYLRSPNAPRHALDHYMPISLYPFVGADLRNLSPMCDECNSSFKKQIDILYDENHNRMHCVDPYSGPIFKISLINSKSFEGEICKGMHLPKWQIDIIGGTTNLSNNWDRIFQIKKRYERDILNAEFRSWLEHFAKWFIRQPNKYNGFEDNINYHLNEYIETVIQEGLADRAFLKAQVFNFILNEINQHEKKEDMLGFLNLMIDIYKS